MLNNLNTRSKTYLIGLVVGIAVIFLLTAVTFLWVAADKLDIIFSQKPGITYTYFISIMDRILVFMAIFGGIPLTLYQVSAKNKTKTDRGISIVSIFVLIACTGVFLAGEYHFYNSYKMGELSNSVMFCSQPEFKIFNKILTKNGEQIPQMCIDKQD